MRQRSARRLPAVLHLRGCWQLGANAMRHLALTQRQLPEGMTGASLQCTVTTPTTVAVLLMACPCFTGQVLQLVRTQPVHFSQPAALLQGRALVSRQIPA